MSTESKAFWEDYQKRNFTIDVPALLDAYAAAQVAAKDAEIRNLESYVAQLESDNANNSMNLDHLDSLNKALKADNERMREGIQALIDSEQGFDQDQCVFSANNLKAILSTADGYGVDARKCKCGAEAEAFRPCPYADEIGGNIVPCNCCSTCYTDCVQSI